MGLESRRQLPPDVVFARFEQLWSAARELMSDERFLHWQVAFPGVWTNWEAETLDGGFDAVIGNPPWDRMKLQQVEWFAERRPEIALDSAGKRPKGDDRGAHRIGGPFGG